MVPSSDKMVSLPRKRSVLSRPVLISTVEIAGHSCYILGREHLRFRLLNALLASTSSIASEGSSTV